MAVTAALFARNNDCTFVNNRHFRVDYADYVDYACRSEHKNSFGTSVDNRHFRHFRAYCAYNAYYAYKMPPRTIHGPRRRGDNISVISCRSHFAGINAHKTS